MRQIRRHVYNYSCKARGPVSAGPQFVIALISVGVMLPVVVVVVLVRPVALVHAPAIRVMVIVRVRPVGACTGRTLPCAVMPDPTSAIDDPKAIGPYVAGSRHRRRYFVTQW